MVPFHRGSQSGVVGLARQTHWGEDWEVSCFGQLDLSNLKLQTIWCLGFYHGYIVATPSVLRMACDLRHLEVARNWRLRSWSSEMLSQADLKCSLKRCSNQSLSQIRRLGPYWLHTNCALNKDVTWSHPWHAVGSCHHPSCRNESPAAEEARRWAADLPEKGHPWILIHLTVEIYSCNNIFSRTNVIKTPTSVACPPITLRAPLSPQRQEPSPPQRQQKPN